MILPRYFFAAVVLGLGLGFSLSTTAFAGQTITIKDQAESKNLAEDTAVELPRFRVIVPKGWSFRGVVLEKPSGDDQMTLDFIATPTEDIAKSKTYVGVREITARMSLDQYKERLARRKHHKVRTVDWGGEKWLLDEYPELAADETPLTSWTAHVIRAGKEYLVLASVPDQDRKRYEESITHIMSSIRLLNPPRSH